MSRSDAETLTTGTPRWVKVFVIIVIVLILLVGGFMLFEGGGHGPGGHATWNADRDRPVGLLSRLWASCTGGDTAAGDVILSKGGY